MSEQIPPQQPPFTNVPYSDVPPPTGQAGYPPPAVYPPAAASSGLSDNSAAALAYITIIPAIIFLIVEPYNKIPLVRFHSIQCLALAVVNVVLWVGVTILHIALHFIPFIGFLFALLHLAIFLVIFVAWLMAILKASKGEWFKLPIIGDFAEKQARS